MRFALALIILLSTGLFFCPTVTGVDHAMAQHSKKKLKKRRKTVRPRSRRKQVRKKVVTVKKYKAPNIGLPWKNWKSTENLDNLLVGRIWSKRFGTYITPRALANQLATKDYILIGEVHDNLDHHLLQAWLVRQISVYDRKPPIVMEMISQDQEPALKAFMRQSDESPEKLGEAIGWSKRGWPAWENYLPIVQMAYAARLPIVAGDARKIMIKTIGKKGFDALGYEGKQHLRLHQDLAPVLKKSLIHELSESHCGLVPEETLEPMSRVQQYKDAVMADRLVSVGDRKGAVLIAGNGHVRSDRGVPLQLRRKRPESLIASVMLVEAQDGANYLEDIVPIGPDGQPAADYVWITPGHKRPDQCEMLKKKFLNKKS